MYTYADHDDVAGGDPKSNGNFYLLLWNEPPVWNEATHSEIVPPATTVTIQIGGPARPVNVYNPIVSGSPRRARSRTTQLKVQLGAAPVIVEVLPAA